MLKSFSDILNIFLSKNTVDNDLKRKIIMLNSLSLSGSLVLVIMSIFLIIEKSYFYAFTNISVSIIIFVFFILFNKKCSFKICSRTIIFIVQLYFIYLFLSGAGKNMAFVWYFVYPLIAFFILELRFAVLYCALIIIITLVLNIFSPFIPVFVSVPFFKLFRIIISYLCVYLFTFIFEKTRLSIQLKYESALIEMENLTRIDGLTGLFNRRYMNDVISNLLIQGQRTKLQMAFIMTDIDYFKKYNDTYGHPSGDDILVKYSKLINSLIRRKTDYIFRYGGEVFLIILTAVDFNSVKIFTENIIEKTSSLSIPHKSSPFKKLTVSAGAVYFETPVIDSLNKIINTADEALYNAKKAGRNCYSITDYRT